MVDTNKLKSRLTLAGYTQERLAKEAKMSLNSLNHKINGRKVFNCDEVDAVCEVLGISNPVEKAEIFLS